MRIRGKAGPDVQERVNEKKNLRKGKDLREGKTDCRFSITYLSDC